MGEGGRKRKKKVEGWRRRKVTTEVGEEKEKGSVHWEKKNLVFIDKQ